MLKFGSEPFLECSSKGDKRFSAFHAVVGYGGVWTSIENHYQAAKVFEDGSTNLSWKEAKGRKAVNQEKCAILYSRLWDRYMSAHPELIDYAKEFNGFSDIFGQEGHVCQAAEIYRIMYGKLPRAFKEVH